MFLQGVIWIYECLYCWKECVLTKSNRKIFYETFRGVAWKYFSLGNTQIFSLVCIADHINITGQDMEILHC
jgi:hypothetical protein